MIALAFTVLAVMLGFYVLLDGYDLGVGAVHLFVARGDAEREATLEGVGPVFHGNEVWLVAAGGTLFALFPQVYASSFSGFYLPFMVVLWLLMFRGIALELRGHFASDLWHSFFDVAFAVSSVLLAFLFGVALGNVLRGLPLDAAHYFNGTFAFLLNPYALGVGLLAVLAVAQHGAAWIAGHLEGPPAKRALGALHVLWPLVVLGALLVTVATFEVHSPLPNLHAMPWVATAPLASLVGLAGVAFFLVRGPSRRIFDASLLFLGGMIGSAAVTLYPYLLPGYPSAESGLSAYRNAPPAGALATTLAIVIAGLVLVGAYRAIVVRRLAGKMRA